ncbi:Aldo/keto reductase [Trichoderma compactum]
MPQLCYRVLSTCQENLPAAQLRFAMGRLTKGLLQGMLNPTSRLEMTEAVLASTGDGHVPHPERRSSLKKASFQTRSHSSSASSVASITLNDGNMIPQVALGVAITAALDAGYRHIDSAARYANEEACGRAICRWMRKTGTPREEIFVCSKLWDSDHGYEATFNALCSSLDKLGLEYLDLHLIHSPAQDEEKRLESWRALETARRLGKVKSIGVSNFGAAHIENLLQNARVIPAVNQVEVHPFCQRQALVELCNKHGIMIEAYSPLARGNKLEDPVINAIANNLTPSRIQSNLESFDFEPSEEDVETINALGAEDYVTGSMHKSSD